MFKSNCEGSHFPRWLSFFNTRDLQSWPTRQTWYSAPRLPSAPLGQSLHLRPMHCQTACSYIAAAASPRPSACSRSLRPRAPQVCSLLRRAAPSGCVRDRTEDRAAGVWRRPSNRRAPLGRPNCTHACDSASCSLSCLGMCAAHQLVPSAGWEGVGGRWSACAIP